MDRLWHAAILDTQFYVDLQAALGLILHHRPVGAHDEEIEQRKKRLSAMKALYYQFFSIKLHDSELKPLPPRSVTNSEVRLVCKIRGGRIVQISVKRNTTLCEIIDILDPMIGVKSYHQALRANGLELQDDNITANQYNLKDGDLIHVNKRLRGS